MQPYRYYILRVKNMEEVNQDKHKDKENQLDSRLGPTPTNMGLFNISSQVTSLGPNCFT